MAAPGGPDYDKLEEYFRALAYANRLELLHLLRFPRALQEITLTAKRSQGGQNPERVISRQAIQEHLAKLLEIGVIVPHEAEAARGRKEFIVNGQRLYQIMEEFRQVGTVLAANAGGRDATVGLPPARAGDLEPGPKLVLVHGLLEGKAFPLRRTDLAPGGRGWILGRKQGLQVSLPYDPFVSLENSEIVLDAGQHRLVDLRSSRNGTWLNWQRLGPGDSPALRPGDVVGVGRSLLVFRAE